MADKKKTSEKKQEKRKRVKKGKEKKKEEDEKGSEKLSFSNFKHFDSYFYLLFRSNTPIIPTIPTQASNPRKPITANKVKDKNIPLAWKVLSWLG